MSSILEEAELSGVVRRQLKDLAISFAVQSSNMQ